MSELYEALKVSLETSVLPGGLDKSQLGSTGQEIQGRSKPLVYTHRDRFCIGTRSPVNTVTLLGTFPTVYYRQKTVVRYHFMDPVVEKIISL